MRIPGRRAARVAWRWARSRGAPRAAILGYHRVADDPWDPLDLGLRVDRFEEHLAALRKHAVPMRVGDLAERLDRRELPARAVAVTFDDGYRNNLDVVKPLLERYDVPATLFVVSGGRGREFWWDELVRILRPGRALPSSLRVPFEDGETEWPTDDRAARRRSAVGLARRLMHLSPAEVRQRLDRMWDQAGGPADEPAAYRCMTDAELRATSAGGLIEIGSHTVHHPFLAGRDPQAQRTEVADSKSDLEAATGAPVSGFSYPNGSKDAASIAEVRAAGYAYACSSDPDLVRPSSSRWELPRFWLPPGSGREFARWFARWVG